MALPPMFHFESKSKMSAPGHIAIGTCTKIGCNGCPSHFPFKMFSSHFIFPKVDRALLHCRM